MSHIVISTSGGIRNTGLVASLRNCLTDGTTTIAKALEQGTPLFEGELFTRPQEERFAKIKALLAALIAAGIEPLVWEAGSPISSGVLLNIMQASEDSSGHFERLDDLGHEA